MRKEILAIVAVSTLAGSSPGTQSETFDMSELPTHLPGRVAAQIPNVAATEEGALIHPGDLDGYMASAVRIGTNQYITAGHVIKNKDNTLLNRVSNCGDLNVDTTSGGPTVTTYDTATRPVYKYGMFSVVVRRTGQYEEADSGKASSVPDIALLQTVPMRNDGAQLNYVVPTVLRKDGIADGTQVFLENYEPTAQGKLRDPLELNLSDEDLEAGLNKPALLGGMVVRHLANGTLGVIVGTRSYGRPAEALVRPGSSGGPVYDAAGNLVGISDRSTASMSVDQLEKRLGINITGVDPKTPLVETVVQPVTPGLLGMLRQQIAMPSAACVPTR